MGSSKQPAISDEALRNALDLICNHLEGRMRRPSTARPPLAPENRATAFAGLFASLDDIQRSAEFVRDHAEFLEERLG